MTTVDALILWARTFFARLGELRRQATRPERLLCIAVALSIAQGVFLGVLDGGRQWTMLANLIVIAWAIASVVMDGVIVRDNLKRAGQAMISVNTAKPTGAPRVAEVTCNHGDAHRFVYGPSGWELAGPAVEHRPIQKEVPTS